MWHIVLVATLFMIGAFGIHAWAIARGHPPELARTMAMNMIVVLEIFHLFFVRSLHGTSLAWHGFRGTRAVWTCLAVIVPLQLAVTYAPPLHAILGTAAVPLAEGAVILAAGVVFFAILEAEKQARLALRPRPA